LYQKPAINPFFLRNVSNLFFSSFVKKWF